MQLYRPIIPALDSEVCRPGAVWRVSVGSLGLLETGDHGRARVVRTLLVGVLGEVGQAEAAAGCFFLVVGVDQSFAVARAVAAALRPARLHAHARLEARDHVGARSVAVSAPREHVGAVGVVAAEVEEVDAREGDKEAADEGERVDGFGGVEALEEDKRGAERGGGECDIVKGVYAIGGQLRLPRC